MLVDLVTRRPVAAKKYLTLYVDIHSVLIAMPWSKVGRGKYQRPLGENETFIKVLADAARQFNREHWAINIVVAITPLGALTQENLAQSLREAWKALRFLHPTLAAYVVNGDSYVYDIPDSNALERWATETFRVVEDKTADEMIACMTPGPYATMTYLPRTQELLGHSQHWRTDGVGGMILMDDFFDLATRFPPNDTSSLQWGQEIARLAPPIEEAASIPMNPSAENSKLGAECVETFGLADGVVGIVSRASAETLPGSTHIARLHLTEAETSAVLQACKIRKTSVTAAVHASVAAANYALAASSEKTKHYTSTIRYSFRPFLPKPFSGREYAATIFTTGWMFAVPAESSWEERAKMYHEQYHKGLSPQYISAHREYAKGLCNLLRSLSEDRQSPTDVDISSMGVLEKFIVAAIPFSIAIYQYASAIGENGEEPYPTQLIKKYWVPREEWERRNKLAQEVAAEAARDRQLFTNQPVNHAVDFSYTEGLNQRSPYNVVAGQQGADLRKLKAYYDEKYRKMEERRLARIGPDGRIRTVFDI
ncbi:MAG: hypothetical protein Q9227_003671 [Pyrenula ochraceoflavens]